MSVVISSDLVLNEQSLNYPLSHARIGYRNLAPGATVSATPAASGTQASMVQNDFTYERFEAASTSTARIAFDLGAADSVNYCGIAAHNIESIGATVTFQSSPDNATWSDVLDFNPANDDAIMLLFDTENERYYRVVVDGASSPAQVGVIYFGMTLDMQRPIYGGHGPITLNRTVAKRSARSDSGQFLGNNIVRRGQSTSFDWQNLTAAWYRNNFDAFARYAEENPFFIAWRPLTYPAEVGFVEATQPASPSNMGTRDLMSVSMQVRGFAQ